MSQKSHHITTLNLPAHIIINADKNRAVRAQELFEKRKAGIHHAQPAVMAIQGLAFLAHHLPKPFADLRAVDIVIVAPALIARIVWRINVDTLHLPGVSGQKRLEGVQIIALHEQIAGIAAMRKFRDWLKQTERHLFMMADDSFLANPLQYWHLKPLLLIACPGTEVEKSLQKRMRADEGGFSESHPQPVF